jgi:hypothetical protein
MQYVEQYFSNIIQLLIFSYEVNGNSFIEAI